MLEASGTGYWLVAPSEQIKSPAKRFVDGRDDRGIRVARAQGEQISSKQGHFRQKVTSSSVKRESGIRNQET
jgi:hypothetical protein